MTGLYYVKDIVSNVRISNMMEFPNEAIACRSFSQFLEKKPEGERVSYKLIKACQIKDNDIIEGYDSYKIVATGSNYIEKQKEYIDYYTNKYNNEE